MIVGGQSKCVYEESATDGRINRSYPFSAPAAHGASVEMKHEILMQEKQDAQNRTINSQGGVLWLMQPYFFPHLGYFDLINRADTWIFFDRAAFSKNGWANRNRILHPKSGWMWITAPVKKHPLGTSIAEIRLADEDGRWKSKILGQFNHYKKQAPYYRRVMKILEETLESGDNTLGDVAMRSVEAACTALGLDFAPKRFSAIENELALEEDISGGGWALAVARKLEVARYVNSAGGTHLYDPKIFSAHGVTLELRDLPPLRYSCGPFAHHERLSILDVLMWVSPDEIRSYLDAHP